MLGQPLKTVLDTFYLQDLSVMLIVTLPAPYQYFQAPTNTRIPISKASHARDESPLPKILEYSDSYLSLHN